MAKKKEKKECNCQHEKKKKQKMYSVPDEIHKMWGKQRGLTKLRDVYAKLPFCYKRAVRASTDQQLYELEFWTSIRKLYPELDEETITYHPDDRTVSVSNDDN